MTSIGTWTSRRPRRSAAGFTLSEIMIALGVIVVGLGMAAGAFHAGIQNHKTTIDNILRTMIGENALGIARVRLDREIDLTQTPRAIRDTEIGAVDKQYPVGYPSGMGYLLYASKPSDRNDFSFVVIPYSLTALTNRFKNPEELGKCRVKAIPLLSSVSITENADRVTSTANTDRRSGDIDLLLPPIPGSKDKQTGRKVVDLYGGTAKVATVIDRVGRSGAVLNKLLPQGKRPTVSSPPLSVLVVRYYPQITSDANTDVSDSFDFQIMDSYSSRTALPPAQGVTDGS